MAVNESYRNLLYHYEVLRARLILREHYLKTIVKDVYENIGQVLALVRVQLGILELGVPVPEKIMSETPDKLIESSIRLLKDMCQRFYLDLQVNTTIKLNQAIAQLISSYYPNAEMQDPGDNNSLQIHENKSLVLLAMLIDILVLLRANKIDLTGASASRDDRNAAIELDYSGNELQLNNEKQQDDPFSGSICDRAAMLNGSVEIKNMKEGRIRVKLVMPIN
jgi:hypothetical protein